MGVAGTLGGVLITQRRADQREESIRKQERKREQERWDREDQLRTFEHRRDAYIAYFEAVKAMGLRVLLHGQGKRPETDLEPGWWSPAFDLLNKLLIFADSGVAEAAGAAYACARNWGEKTSYGREDSVFVRWANTFTQLEANLLHQIRRDLGIPGPPLSIVPNEA
jgi:hypothetical protein